MSSTRTMSKMAVCVAIICISAYLSFPIPFTTIPFTFLTLALLLTAFLLTPSQTFIVLIVYVLLGAVGLPVFVGGSGGIGALLSPSGGYLLGFIVAYPISSMLKGHDAKLLHYFVAGLVSIPITYFFGVAGLCLITKISITQAIIIGALPFIIGDIVKNFLAAYIGSHLQKVLPKDA